MAKSILTVLFTYSDIDYSRWNIAGVKGKIADEVAGYINAAAEHDGEARDTALAITAHQIARACRKNGSASILLDEDTPSVKTLTVALAALGVDVYLPTYSKGKLKSIDLPTLPASKAFMRKAGAVVALL